MQAAERILHPSTFHVRYSAVPIYDDLARRRYANIEPFKFTSVSKVELIQRLIVAVEQQRVGWPEEWKVLTNEMQRYEYEITARGRLSFFLRGMVK